MANLSMLPAELLIEIVSQVAVDDLLNFALTSSRIHQHLERRLDENKVYHGEYRIQHDRLPLTVPTLLRLALTSSDARWHIKTFDSWEIRLGFNQWKNWSFFNNRDEECWGPLEDHSKLTKFYYSETEYEMFHQVMAKEFNLDESTVNFCVDKITAGWDEPLKVMLFALLPGIKKLNFIAFSSDDFEGDAQQHALRYINMAIVSIAKGLQEGQLRAWPAGFLSLRHIMVCTTTHHQHPHDAWYAPPSAAAILFRLPNLKILDLSLVGLTNNESDDTWDLLPCSSSIEELSFYVCDFPSIKAWERFVRAPRSLRKIYIEASGDMSCMPQIFRTLEEHHGSLEYLHIDGHYHDGLDTMAQSFPQLKHVGDFRDTNLLWRSTSSKDMALRPECNTHIHALKRSRRGGKGVSYQIADLAQMLPISIESFWFRVYKDRLVNGKQMLSNRAIRSELLRAVADLVEDERFDNLREICLYDLIPNEGSYTSEANSWTDNVGSEWDWGAFRRIEARGIETHLHNGQGKPLKYEEHYLLHTTGKHQRNVIESDPCPDHGQY